MSSARPPHVLAPVPARYGAAEAGAPEFEPAFWRAALERAAFEGGGVDAAGVEQDMVDVAAGELARRLRHLRATLARYVRARRDAGVPVARVLDEVRTLVRAGTACEAWTDPDDALTAQALRCARGVYHEHDPPACSRVVHFS